MGHLTHSLTLRVSCPDAQAPTAQPSSFALVTIYCDFLLLCPSPPQTVNEPPESWGALT